METRNSYDTDLFSFSKTFVTSFNSNDITKYSIGGENVNTQSLLNNSSIDELIHQYLEEKDSYSTSLVNILNERSKEEMNRGKEYFIKLLRNTEFEDGIDNEVTDYFSQLMKNNKSVALQWINALYNDSLINGDNVITVKILNLLSDYSLEDLRPNGQLMVVVGLASKNRFVQAKAIKVLGHWMDYDTLKMAGNIDITSPWVEMMLNKIRGKIEKRYAGKSL